MTRRSSPRWNRFSLPAAGSYAVCRWRLARQSGPAASGAVLVSPDGQVLQEVGHFLGRATNNVAEWTALELGLQAALERGVRVWPFAWTASWFVKQISGEYRVKHPDLQPLHRRVSSLLRKFEHVDVRHVRRKENALADAVVNRVLDASE